MADEMQQAPEAAGQTAQDQNQQQSTELTINDLNAMKSIIDIASSRGAFKPNEMMAVGQTYTKLEAFLNNVAKQVEAQKKAEQGGQ
jgi:type II secretory pathway component PulF